MTARPSLAIETKRILVALDTSARGQAALQVAIRLALNTSAELQGLFVEDEDLVRLASLPFAREVDFASAAPRELQSVNMEQALHAAGRETQQVFSNALQQVNLHWTFRVVRGTITQTSLAAANDVDLVIIGQQGRSPKVLAANFLPTRPDEKKHAVVIFDGSPSAFRALEFATSLADSAPLMVLVLANNGEEVGQQCVSWLAKHNVRAEVDRALNPSRDAIIDFVNKWPARLLVINRDSEFISDSQIGRLVNEFDCPLVLC
jgi:nucleotide-binding universal stress UspA family protein